MSETTLRDLVLKRLEADTKPEDEWSALVLAALEGPDELAKLLDEEAPEAAKPLSPRAPAPSSRGAEGVEGSAVVSPSAPSPPRESPSSAPKVLGPHSAVGCGAGGRFTMSLASAEPSAWLLQVTEQSRLTPDSAVSLRGSGDGRRSGRAT